MSQAGQFQVSALPPGTIVETLEGNSGGPVGPNGANNIFVVGDGLTVDVTGNPGTNTLTISTIGAEAHEYDTDDGNATPMGGILNIIANHAANNAGATVEFTGAGNTVTLNVSDGNGNTIVGSNSGNLTLAGADNSIFGESSGVSLTSGNNNTICGATSGNSITSGSNNIIVGKESLTQLATGSYNIVMGVTTIPTYTSTESNNIIIGNSVSGVALESNVLRIGDATGAGTGGLQKAFICGIDGVNVGSVATVVTEAGNQLGTAVITGGTGITVTPGANTITITSSGITTLTYTNVNTSPYVVLPTDDYLSVDSSGGPIAIELPDAATLGKTYVIKDRTGTADTNAITITTVSGLVNIDGATTFVMDNEYQATSLIGNGATYELY